MRKVLVANRGEIAVRLIRAAKDFGVASVAIYAEPDADSLFVRLADEAFALPGSTPAQTYLNQQAVLAVARRSGADAVHPGYGFLAENAEFARVVIEAGLTWIGPPPEAIDLLGDKVRARELARRIGAPLVPGTDLPIADAEEAVAFAQEHGLPIAIKAAFGGGGRGMRVARTLEEIPERFAAATREAVTAFGRGECFVERYLERPRHIETQCLADQHGTVVVLSTRDCSLQRRHQKLLEEAPAPFLTDAQRALVATSSRNLLRAGGYVGAGTCEFLLAQDGTISFLEVNTRLQVEHPVTEEVTGLDLVGEMFRIADGEPLGYSDPPTRGHSIEFRINAEDAARDFLPSPGTLTDWQPPTGPGVRVDEGYHPGMTVPGNFDSLVAKIIVTGPDRATALARARRALDETVVEGMPTALPFHRAVLNHPDFIGTGDSFAIHTRWIETEFNVSLPPYAGPALRQEALPTETFVVEVDSRRIVIKLPAALTGGTRASTTRRAPSRRSGATGGPAAPSTQALTAPMQGTIISIAVSEGDLVAQGDLILVLEAMKMEQQVTAHRPGTVRHLVARPGAGVSSGEVLCEID
ncbi:MAG: ATP-grasp domain-containing protein [Micropruina sp.]|nr:ATP-grasp domain-containing protein [Micropruina sp.]